MDDESEEWVRVDKEDYDKEAHAEEIFYKCRCGEVGRINKKKIADIFRGFCPGCNKVIIGDYEFIRRIKIIDFETFLYERRSKTLQKNNPAT